MASLSKFTALYQKCNEPYTSGDPNWEPGSFIKDQKTAKVDYNKQTGKPYQHQGRFETAAKVALVGYFGEWVVYPIAAWDGALFLRQAAITALNAANSKKLPTPRDLDQTLMPSLRRVGKHVAAYAFLHYTGSLGYSVLTVRNVAILAALARPMETKAFVQFGIDYWAGNRARSLGEAHPFLGLHKEFDQTGYEPVVKGAAPSAPSAADTGGGIESSEEADAPEKQEKFD